VEINAFSEGQMQSKTKFRATNNSTQKEGVVLCPNKEMFKFMTIFGSVQKQKSRKTEC
jgi:hypothetical protein